MNTRAANTMINAQEKKPLLMEAFDALLTQLGPEKAARVWQILTVPEGDYLALRPKLFAGKDIDTIYREAEEFNRKQ